MNHAISINSNSVNIQWLQNDNSHIIRGHGPDGYVDKTIMKDDPEADKKVQNLLEELHDYQQQELAAYVEQAPAKLDSQWADMQAAMDEQLA